MKSFKTLLMFMVASSLLSFSATAEEMQMKMESNQMMGMGKSSMQGGSAPANARSGDYSDGYEYRGIAGWEETDTISFSKVIADQMEFRSNSNGNNTLRYDMQGWRGTDYNKVWLKLEGDNELKSRTGESELQALYSRSVAPFWDFQIGARYDSFYEPGVINDRFLAVIGFQGLAPYWFDLEPAIFVSDKGDVSARITATYDLLLTQRLILQPRVEVNAALREARQYGVGKGLYDTQLGFRLRYEVRREFAPYVGLSWQKQFVVKDNMALLAGVRWWF